MCIRDSSYATSIEESQSLMSGMQSDMILKFEDSGRSLLGFVAPFDVSWLDNVTPVSYTHLCCFFHAETVAFEAAFATFGYVFEAFCQMCIRDSKYTLL